MTALVVLQTLKDSGLATTCAAYLTLPKRPMALQILCATATRKARLGLGNG